MVVASQRPEKVLESHRSVDRLGRREMLQLAPRSTPELLESTAGVVVQKTNHAGGSPFIRGFTGQQILFLIDGVRLNNSTVRYGPNQLLNTVDPFVLSRVEILRGPGSLLYGSDAIGGVIYMTSRGAPYRPDATLRWGGEATTRFSTADRSQAYHLSAYTQVKRLTVYAGGTYKDFRNLVGGRGIGEQAWTGYGEGDYHGAVMLYLEGGWAVKVATHGTRQYNAPRTDKCSDTDFRYFKRQFRDLVYAKLSGRQGRALDRFELTLSYQRHRERRDRFRLGKDRIEIENDFVHTVGLALVGGSNLGRYSKLAWGLDAYFDHVRSHQRRESITTGADLASDPVSYRGRFVDGSQYLQGGAFVTDTIAPLGWLKLDVGGRFSFAWAGIPEDPLAAPFGLPQEAIHDAAFGFGGGLALTFVPHKSLRLIASVQHAFRAPSLDDYSHLGSEGSGFDVPSPRLSPEQATTFEVGAKWACRWVTAQIFGHYSLLYDFIARAYTGDTVDGEPATIRTNAGDGTMAGLEGEVTVRLPHRFYLTAWIAWTRGDLTLPLQDPATQPIRRVSPLQGLVALGYRGRRYFARVDLRWSARQDRLSPGDLNDARICPDGPDRCDGTPGFAVVSLAGGVRLGRHVDLTLRLENLSNEPYKVHGSGVYSPGLSAVALLRVRR